MSKICWWNFCMFWAPTHFINVCPLNTNINFTVEHENIGSLLFLDLKVYCKNNKFVTSVYRKPTFGEVFTNYENFIPTYQKRGLLHMLLHRSFSTYFVISRHFIWKLLIWRQSSGKSIILWILLIRLLSYFLTNSLNLKLLFRMYLKEMFFLSCYSWKVIRFKCERSFTNYTFIQWGIVI